MRPKLPATFQVGREYQFEDPPRVLPFREVPKARRGIAERTAFTKYDLRITKIPSSRLVLPPGFDYGNDAARDKGGSVGSRLHAKDYIGFAVCDITTTIVTTYVDQHGETVTHSSRPRPQARVPVVLKLFKSAAEGEAEMAFQKRVGEAFAPRVITGVHIGKHVPPPRVASFGGGDELGDERQRPKSVPTVFDGIKDTPAGASQALSQSPHPMSDSTADRQQPGSKPPPLDYGAILRTHSRRPPPTSKSSDNIGSGLHSSVKPPQPRPPKSKKKRKRPHIRQLGVLPVSSSSYYATTPGRQQGANEDRYKYAIMMECAPTCDTLHDVIHHHRMMAVARLREQLRQQRNKYMNALSSLKEAPLDLSAQVSGAVSITEFVDFARRMCQCVQALHEQDVVHLDIKPSQFVQFAHLKLIDFGSSVDLSESEGSVYRNASSLRVTEEYCAPEIYRAIADRSKVQVSRKADIWSLGLTLLRLAAGCLPWDAPPDIAAVDEEPKSRRASNSSQSTPRKVTATTKGEGSSPSPLAHSASAGSRTPHSTASVPRSSHSTTLEFQRLWDRLSAMRYATPEDEHEAHALDAQFEAAGDTDATDRSFGPFAGCKATCPMPVIDPSIKRLLLKLLWVDPQQRFTIDDVLRSGIFAAPQDTKQLLEKDLLAFLSEAETHRESMTPQVHVQQLQDQGYTHMRLEAVTRIIRAMAESGKPLQLRSELSAFNFHNLSHLVLMPRDLEEFENYVFQHNPLLIHFAGHGSEHGQLAFPKRWASGSKFVNACCISDRLHTVFINTCHGSRMASALVNKGHAVICWLGLVETQTALHFAKQFYYKYSTEIGVERSRNEAPLNPKQSMLNRAKGAAHEPAHAVSRRGLRRKVNSSHIRVLRAFQYARQQLQHWLRQSGNFCGDPMSGNTKNIRRGIPRLFLPHAEDVLAVAAEADSCTVAVTPQPLGSTPWALAGSGGGGGAASSGSATGRGAVCRNLRCKCRLWCCHEHWMEWSGSKQRNSQHRHT